MNWANITNAEWREFQAIPEQGYSHRAWVDGAIRRRLDQLRTDEAVERAARAVFDGEYSGAWDAAAEWMREDCRIAARAAITALIGEEP